MFKIFDFFAASSAMRWVALIISFLFLGEIRNRLGNYKADKRGFRRGYDTAIQEAQEQIQKAKEDIDEAKIDIDKRIERDGVRDIATRHRWNRRRSMRRD